MSPPQTPTHPHTSQLPRKCVLAVRRAVTSATRSVPNVSTSSLTQEHNDRIENIVTN